ncbi:Hsp70 family protein [Polaromonas sp. A23]|uniref:Hsp70 family protein n=1 Tax=Polaromonas sp. A23 TaxID=1944133 RepID=UPI000986DBB1|nr:Hsp70 family protein [Polaromonas sp. A23]OOG37906.1 heat-shock protein [Polaromonas sp. A23]
MAGALPTRPDACGIDFGTSNSTAGCGSDSEPGRAVLLNLEDGKPTIPSVVFFHAEDRHISYGRAALADYLAGDEGRLMRSLKSLLGTSLIDEQTEVAGQALPFRALLAQFIGELKRRAEHAAGREFTRAVLGRPVFFVDGDAAADRQAENTLAEIARAVGLKEIAFQYEPIAAAFAYEAQVTREELVLVVDIGGGTSDFALVRLAPEGVRKADRREDILASGGVHIGGTDFDKYLSLGSVMPLLGLGSQLKNGLQMPSAQYFNLATWHTINFAYTKQAWSQISELYREAQEKEKLARLQKLVAERAGHWLAMQVEEAKIALSGTPQTELNLGRIDPGEVLVLHRADFDAAIGELTDTVARAVTGLLRDAGVLPAQVDTVFFTGGSSSVPLLRERVAALLPQARRAEGDLFGSIGSGLAIDALRKFG